MAAGPVHQSRLRPNPRTCVKRSSALPLRKPLAQHDRNERSRDLNLDLARLIACAHDNNPILELGRKIPVLQKEKRVVMRVGVLGNNLR